MAPGSCPVSATKASSRFEALAWVASSAGVPWAMIRPASINATRSQRFSTSSMAWLTRMTVWFCIESIIDQIRRRALGSSPVVSSSRMTACGRPTSASATESRWACPPESFSKRVSAFAVSSTMSIASAVDNGSG